MANGDGGCEWHRYLEQVGILAAELLQHGLQDLGVGLHHLAHGLELRVVAEELQGASPAPCISAAAPAQVCRDTLQSTAATFSG